MNILLTFLSVVGSINSLGKILLDCCFTPVTTHTVLGSGPRESAGIGRFWGSVGLLGYGLTSDLYKIHGVR